MVVAGSSFAQTFTNETDVRLPGTGTGGTTGSAGLYPITFEVSGLGSVTDLNIILEFGTALGTAGIVLGEEHTFADDLDFMLVAPNGMQLIFLSDAGGGNDMNGIYTFDDEALAAIDTAGTGQNAGGNLNTGSYRVSQYGTGDGFVAPAPAADYTNTLLSAFDGIDPNGTWNLYAMDAFSLDAGWLMSSSLVFEPVPEPATMAVLGLGLIPFLRRRKK